MIITGLINLIYGLLSVLLVFDLPVLPATVTTLLDQISGYFVGAVGLLRALVGDTAMGVIALCFQLVLLLNAAYLLYSLVFWVIKKIPMLNIRE